MAAGVAGVVWSLRAAFPPQVAKEALAASATASATNATIEPSAQPPGARPPAPAPTSLRLVDRDCSFEDRGIGDYSRYRVQRGNAEVLARTPAVLPDGSYDLLLHFHGGLPVGRILGPEAKPIVIATIDRGDSSGDYNGTIPTREAFEQLIEGINHAVAVHADQPDAHVARILVSSFSAGYQAVSEILKVAHDHPSLTGVLLLDSLYGSYRGATHNVAVESIEPFELAAKRALESPRFAFILTHSNVETIGYASTKEVATTLLDRLVVRASLLKVTGERGMQRVAEERGFVLRGYGGSDKGAHCAHLALLPELIDVWRSKL